MTGTGRRDQLVAPFAITYSLDNFRDSIVADFVTEQVGNPGNHSSAGNARRGQGKTPTYDEQIFGLSKVFIYIWERVDYLLRSPLTVA
jgi:hypothetical protein